MEMAADLLGLCHYLNQFIRKILWMGGHKAYPLQSRNLLNLAKQLYFGMMMVETGDADAFITGLYTRYSNTIKVAKEVIGIQPGFKHFGTMHIKALCYCLGISDDTRRNINSIYDFKSGCVKTECLHEGWQTSGSMKVVRMAFNLYCNSTPSVDDYKDAEEQVNECNRYTVEDLFCCAYAPFFWQAVQIRYPEYATYNRELYALFGGTD